MRHFPSLFLGLVLLTACSTPVQETSSDLRLFLTLTDTRPSEHRGTGGLPWNTLSSATATDPYHFILNPQEWLRSDDMSDPAVAVNDEGLWVVASGTGTGSLRIASSLACPYVENFPEVFSNGGGIPDLVSLEDGFRIYYTNANGIYSAFSPDGQSWADEGMIFPLPEGLDLVADPAVTQRADGTYVMYFKATLPTDTERTPYYHMVYRATSADGLVWDFENTLLIAHASVPATYTATDGTVWIYYLNFADWPTERETVWATYEEADGTLAEPQEVTFTPTLPDYLWVNDPDPVLVPASVDLGACE